MRNENTQNANIDRIHKALLAKAPELVANEWVIARNVDLAYRHQTWACATFDQCIDFEISYQRRLAEMNGKGVH